MAGQHVIFRSFTGSAAGGVTLRSADRCALVVGCVGWCALALSGVR
jgi:hypothetical protein